MSDILILGVIGIISMPVNIALLHYFWNKRQETKYKYSIKRAKATQKIAKKPIIHEDKEGLNVNKILEFAQKNPELAQDLYDQYGDYFLPEQLDPIVQTFLQGLQTGTKKEGGEFLS